MDWTGYKENELHARNIELGLQIDKIREERREINAELTRRDNAKQAVRSYLRLPAHLQEVVYPRLSGLELAYLSDERLVIGANGDAQLLEPVGVASEFESGPRRRGLFGRRS